MSIHHVLMEIAAKSKCAPMQFAKRPYFDRITGRAANRLDQGSRERAPVASCGRPIELGGQSGVQGSGRARHCPKNEIRPGDKAAASARMRTRCVAISSGTGSRLYRRIATRAPFGPGAVINRRIGIAE